MPSFFSATTLLSSLLFFPLRAASSSFPGSTNSPPPTTFDTSIRCSTASILPTPSYGIQDGAVFTACTEEVIHGDLASVYAATIDFRRYAAWNSFVISVAVPDNVTDAADVYVGLPITFTTKGLLPAGINSTSNEIVTVLRPNSPDNDDGGARRVAVSAWRYDDGLDGVGTRAEHPNILTDLGGGTVRYVSYETYFGPGALLVDLLLRQNLQKEFEAQGRDLKAYVESKSSS